ncbi:MAG TPA: Flp family type IVb pilin, partial [Tepidisphaeraceae bacterium]
RGVGKMRQLWKLLRDQKAATAIEYAMIVAFIAIAAIAAIMGTAGRTNTMWNHVSSNVINNM